MTFLKNKHKTREDLKIEAQKLDVDIKSRVPTQSMSTIEIDDYELQRRIGEAKRQQRDAWTWIIALISAIASAISALAAWYAIGLKG